MLLRDKYNNWDQLGFNTSDRDRAKAGLATYGGALTWANGQVTGGGEYAQYVAKTYFDGQKRSLGQYFRKWTERAFAGPKALEKPHLDWLQVWACDGALFAAAFQAGGT